MVKFNKIVMINRCMPASYISHTFRISPAVNYVSSYYVMKIPEIGTVVSVIMALITAGCATILTTKGRIPLFVVIVHWISPVWYYFLCECLYKGGGYCNYLVWIAILGLTVEAAAYLVLAAFPSKVDEVQSKIGEVELERL